MYPHIRLRRLRQSPNLRSLLAEHALRAADFIYPLFVVPGQRIRREIAAMPGQYQYSVDELAHLIPRLKKSGVGAVLLFGQAERKDATGEVAAKGNNVIVKAISFLKEAFPALVIITDVCLCSYTTHGHCGPLLEGNVDNDRALRIMAEMALTHARAGAHFVAPSGMMDGVVSTLREKLDEAGCISTGILAYSVKYASSFYGPFREAADCSPKSGDRKTYQMNPANVREALQEAELDVAEGADMLMVKPGMPYLDVIARLHEQFHLPIVAYQVSGEYSMIKAAAEKGWVDEKGLVLESLLAFKRAGAQAIITYFALEAAEWLGRTA